MSVIVNNRVHTTGTLTSARQLPSGYFIRLDGADLPYGATFTVATLAGFTVGETVTVSRDALNLTQEFIVPPAPPAGLPVQLTELADALATFAHVVPGIAESASALTCTEAEAIADVLHALGHDELAAGFIAYHAYGDDDPDDQHRAQYLTMHDLPADYDDE